MVRMKPKINHGHVTSTSHRKEVMAEVKRMKDEATKEEEEEVSDPEINLKRLQRLSTGTARLERRTKALLERCLKH